jgi:hypothetical protein
VSLQEDEAVIIADVMTCLDVLVLDLERSSGYVNTIFGWSSRAPPQVAYYGNIYTLQPVVFGTVRAHFNA